MRSLVLLACLLLATAVPAQLKKAQMARLANLTNELPDGWAVRDQFTTQQRIGGKATKGYTVYLFTPLTAHDDGDNEGVGIYLFKKALADSVEASYPPDENSTIEFLYTRSFVVVVSYFTSNGKLYDMYTRSMLKELRNHFTIWHREY